MIYIITDNIKEAGIKMNKDLLNLEKWLISLSEKKLKLNTEKTKYMIIKIKKE